MLYGGVARQIDAVARGRREELMAECVWRMIRNKTGSDRPSPLTDFLVSTCAVRSIWFIWSIWLSGLSGPSG
jgi:hypothetical protein